MPENLSPDPDKGGRSFVPTRSYDLKMVINNIDYTGDLITVRFVSSLSTAYQTVNFVLQLDPTDIIIEQLYGGSSIKLSITLLREEQYPGPRIDLDLMFTNGAFQLNEKEKISTGENKQKMRGYYAVTSVVRDSYKIMNSLVNGVYLGTTVGSILSDVISQAGGQKIEIDTDGQNAKPIDQVCIPPTTLYKIIKEYNSASENPFDGFLDQRFGLFDGVPGIFCQYDKTVQIKNLTSKMQKDPAFIIYQIATDMELNEWDLILDQVSQDNTFYTYQMVSTDYAGNAKFAKVGSNINHIVKPKDTLSQTITQDLETVAGKYSIIYKSKNLEIDPSVKRTRYFNQDTGDEKNETIFNSRISRRLADLSTLTIDIERNLPVLNLLQVGECVKFKPKTIEYSDLEGKYILWSTDIWFRRENAWQTTAQVKLMRTNKRSGETIKPYSDSSVLPEMSALEKANQKIANLNIGKTLAQITEEIQARTESVVELVTQSANETPKPYQSAPPEILEEIQSNQNKIVTLKDKVDKYNTECDEDFGSRRGICNPRANRVRVKLIERLQKRNAVLAIKSRFS